MSPYTSLILLVVASIIAAPGLSASQLMLRADVATDDAKPDYAPIIERRLDYYDFSYQTFQGAPFDLVDYARDKRVVIVEYLAGWCPNSNRNGHILERLWTKYRDRGLGVVGVAEYSDAYELRIHIGRIGIDYPFVVETTKLGQRKDSRHYKYRHAVGDKRKWGTPFYVIIDMRDIEPISANGPLARRIFTVSGELADDEADRFIRERLADAQSK